MIWSLVTTFTAMHPQKDMQGYQYSPERLYPVDFYVGPRIWHIHTLAARVYPSEYTALFVWRELCASVNAQPFGLLERVLSTKFTKTNGERGLNNIIPKRFGVLRLRP